MTITIEINTANAAFEDSEEMGRILHKMVDRICTKGEDFGKLIDINGNIVGEFDVRD